MKNYKLSMENYDIYNAWYNNFNINGVFFLLEKIIGLYEEHGANITIRGSCPNSKNIYLICG